MATKWRKLILGALITAAAAYLVFTHLDKIRADIVQRDSMQYWAAAKQMIHGENAYEVRRIRTPPWSLFLFLPLGIANAFWGWVLWIAASVASLILSMRLSWKMFGRGAESRSFFLIVGYLFAPVLACLESGQIGLILLVGIILFLAYENSRPFVAGTALVIPFAKPHLLVFFWMALLFWVVARKRFTVAAGFITGVAGATILALLLDSHVIQHYRELLRTAQIDSDFIPTVSGVVRLIFFRQYFRVQFIPTLLGMIWCMWFCFRNIRNWSWRDHGLTVMAVSILTTPYSFLNDEVVLLPAILFSAMRMFDGKEKPPVGTRIVILTCGFLNWIMLMLLALQIPLQSGIYFWSSLLWCGWFFYGRWRGNGPEGLRRLAVES